VAKRVRYPDDQCPAWLIRLSRFLAARYGEPEGYGLCFQAGRELWGSTWRAKDRGRLISFDHVRHERSGITETLVTIHRTATGEGRIAA
jgi:hypothetical protein